MTPQTKRAAVYGNRLPANGDTQGGWLTRQPQELLECRPKLVVLDLFRSVESQVSVALELDLALQLRDERSPVDSPLECEVEDVASVARLIPDDRAARARMTTSQNA